MAVMAEYLFVFICVVAVSTALDNGLARTPPMGWLSWTRFACEIDCDTYPDDCISEHLYKRTADLLASEGYKDAGYEYVNIDDCWSEKERDPISLKLIADRKRFPSGIKALADYVHSKGLKLGIYTDMGTKTCAGYPGLLIANGSAADYMLLDAETYASWGVDSLKVDGCNADPQEFDWLYPRLGLALNLTGRSILYSCSWPDYQLMQGKRPDYASIARHCNLWRNFDDIGDSWQSVSSIIDFYAKNQDSFIKYNGPGAWFDPDMIIVGNTGLSYEQSKAQMALWAILSAPLLMSNDLSTVSDQLKSILLNKHVIGVNQDKFGFMGRRIVSGNKQVWVKPMSPVVDGRYSFAVVYLNQATLGIPTFFNHSLSRILDGFEKSDFYNVYDLYADAKLIFKLNVHENLVLRVNTSGSVRMVKLVPVSAYLNSMHSTIH